MTPLPEDVDAVRTLRVTVGYQTPGQEFRTGDLVVDEESYEHAVREGQAPDLLQRLLPPGAVLKGFTVSPDQQATRA